LEEYIRLLDLPDEFDFAILKKAYRKKVKIYHPDKAKTEAERTEFESIMKRLNEANEYLKEYLERHDGKYTKPAEDTKQYYEEETETKDYSNSDNYEERNSYYESTPEEEYSEETAEEYYEYEDADENLTPSGANKVSIVEFALEVIKIMFNPIRLFEEIKKSNIYAPIFESPRNMIFSIILFFLIFYPSCKFIDKYIYPDVDSNNTPKQESVQEYNTQAQIPEELQTQQQPQPQPQQETTPQPPTVQDSNKQDIKLDNSTTEIGRYMRDAQRRIKLNWDLPKNIMAEKGYDEVKVVVEFTVAKDGQLIDEPQIKQSSGLDIVDKRCIEAVQLTAPFKPLPEEIKKDNIKMEFTFEGRRR